MRTGMKMTRIFRRPKQKIGGSRPKRADTGLFHGVGVLSGTTVTFSDKKSKRKWKPNIKAMSLYSETLGKKLRLKVSMKALRNIEHKGGLDNYILQTPKHVMDSKLANHLKSMLIAKQIQTRRKNRWERTIDEYANALKEHLKENPELLQWQPPAEASDFQLELEKMAFDDAQARIKNREFTLRQKGHLIKKISRHERHRRMAGVKKYVANMDIEGDGDVHFKTKDVKIYNENGVLFKG
eukprot:gene2108-1975_t